MIFGMIAVLMGLLAVAAVALPLWRGAAAKLQMDNDPAALTHDLQLAELERDLTVGVLAEVDYRAARRDVETEWSRRPALSPEATQPSRGLALVMAMTLLAVSSLLYWRYGNWRVGAEGVEAASVPAVEHMVEELSQRLHGADSADLQGWEMLGHAYVIMERYPDALDAYDHARKLSSDGNADVLAGYAEALTLANEDQHPEVFMQQALPLFEKALSLDPRNPQALWYGGMGAFERGDKALAVQRWQALLAQDPPAEYRRVISQSIAEAGGTPGAVAASASTVTIRMHVSLAPALKAAAGADETLFVFAEPEGGAGGPPLAVKRFHVSDLPLDIELSDQDAVMPGRHLEDYGRLTVTARISPSGSPTPQAGDLEGLGTWSKASAKALDLVIDTPVK